LVEAFPEDPAPRDLLRDRDRIYGQDFSRHVEPLGIREVRIAPRAPWQNLKGEATTDSCRRPGRLTDLIVLDGHRISDARVQLCDVVGFVVWRIIRSR
jgi:hypothetical protein